MALTSRTFGQRDSSVRSHRKLALFIDGANFYSAAKIVGLEVDWKKFLSHFRALGDFYRAYYYTGMLPEGENNPFKPQLDWMVYNGFTLRTKPIKRIQTSEGILVKGNMDIELAIDMLYACPFITDAMLFSGDGDFAPLVKKVQDEGVRVTVVSTVAIEGKRMCADDLRRQCDAFEELLEIGQQFSRN